MPNINPQIQSTRVNKVALGGINSFDDPHDIADVECTDILNMVFDNGSIIPRQGSLLAIAKPNGETAVPFQMLVSTTSDGIDYLLAVYGFNVYLWDTVNAQWIKLNQIYTPPSQNLYYGSANWNNGIIDDRFYFGNGTDDTIKWAMAVNTLRIPAVASDPAITLNDSVRFPTQLELGNPTISIASPAVITLPNHGLVVNDLVSFDTTGALPTGISPGTIYHVIAAGLTANTFEISIFTGGSPVNTSGTQSGIQTLFTHMIPIIVQNGATAVNLIAIGNSSGTLTLTGNVGVDIPVGSTVTMPLIDMNHMPKGKILTKFQNRLFLANSILAENTLNYSRLEDPESFVEDNTDATAGFYTIYKGKGGIINIDDFGQYLVIEKSDILLSFTFDYASDNSGFIVQVTPIISGQSIGPVSNANSVNYMNTLYYTTQVEGIVSFSPLTTGSQTSSGLTVISQKIQQYVTTILNFTNGRTAGWNQKLFWLNSVPILNGIINTINNGVLMYDLIRSVWTRFDNWNAADIKPVNNSLYYLSLNDGGLYQCFVDYQDEIAGNPYPYNVSFSTKRFDFQQPELLSRDVYIYLQGYMSLTTKFYVDVLFNENGYLGKQTYLIEGSNSKIVQNAFLGGLGAYPFGVPLLGGFNLKTMQLLQQPAFFRVYLELSQSFRPNNIQIRCYSQDLGSYWSVNCLTLMTLSEPSIPTQLVLGPTTNPPIDL